MTEGQLEHAALGQPLNLSTRLVMLAGGLMVMIAMSALTPVLPQIEAALAQTGTEKLMVKLLVPISGATMVIGAPLTGFLVDRIGLRPVLLAHSLFYALGGTAGLYLNDLGALVASRLLVGFSAAGMATISMTLINTRLDGIARARWMGFHIATAMFGALIVHPAIGALGEIGWRWPFAMYAGSLILAFAVTGLQVREGSPAAEVSGEPGGKAENPLKWFPLWFLLLAVVMGSVTYLPSVYLAFVVHDVCVESPSAIAMVMLADAIIGGTMALLFGRSQRYISSNNAFIFSFSCTGTGLLIVALASSFTAVIAGMLVFGFGIGWFVPNLMTALSRRVSQARQGQAVGIIKGTHYLASPLAVLAIEPISQAAGPDAAMMSGAVLSFCAVLTFVFITVAPNRTTSFKTAPAAAPE